jgi:hypothetical protein
MIDDHDPYPKQFWTNRNHWLFLLARDENLSAVAVRVGLLFGTFFKPDTASRQGETLKPGYDWLMKSACLGSRTTLSKALRELEENGFLVAEKRYHANTVYRLPFDGESEWLKMKVQKMDS